MMITPISTLFPVVLSLTHHVLGNMMWVKGVIALLSTNRRSKYPPTNDTPSTSATDPGAIDPVSLEITTQLSALPGGFALTGIVDVEKLLTITCDNVSTTYFLEKKLPFQIMFMQLCPAPPLPTCACGFMTTIPINNTNLVKFNDGTGPTEEATLTLQGNVCQNSLSSHFSFQAISDQNQLLLTANATQLTSVTCVTHGSTCDETVMGTGTITLNGIAISNPGFTLTIHCTPGNVTYELEVTNNGGTIFTTNGQVSPISTSELICFCS